LQQYQAIDNIFKELSYPQHNSPIQRRK